MTEFNDSGAHVPGNKDKQQGLSGGVSNLLNRVKDNLSVFSKKSRQQLPEVVNPELSNQIRSKIMLPTEFDQQMESNQGLKEQVAGCTVLSYELFLGGITPNGFSVVPYGEDFLGKYINLDVDNDLVTELSKGYSEPGYQPGKLLQENRKWGLSTIPVSLYHQMIRKPDFDEDFWDFNLGGNLRTVLNRYKEIEAQDLKSLLGNVSLTDYSTEDIIEIIDQSFPSEGSFFQYLDALKDRGGVQIVYGDKPALKHFIEGHKSRLVDDNGVAIYNTKIPERLIIAILPLGIYEQKALLKNSP